MEKRYQALRIIGTIYKILGAIAAGLTILAVIGICATSVLGGAALDSIGRELGGNASGFGVFSGALGGLMISLFAIIYGGGFAITLYAIGQGIDLFLAMEENTRATMMLLQRQAKAAPPPKPSE